MGEQIATNTTMHSNVELFENEAGEYYAVTVNDELPKLIRGEYHPLGNKLQFPKKWGRKEGATILLEHKISEQKRILAGAETELAKLERCLSSVQEWKD
jgi:hypothetical protein